MITTNPNALNVHTAKLVSICFVNISHYTCLPSVTLPTLLSFVCLLNFSPLRLSSILLFLTFALSCSLLQQKCLLQFSPSLARSFSLSLRIHCEFVLSTYSTLMLGIFQLYKTHNIPSIRFQCAPGRSIAMIIVCN